MFKIVFIIVFFCLVGMWSSSSKSTIQFRTQIYLYCYQWCDSTFISYMLVSSYPGRGMYSYIWFAVSYWIKWCDPEIFGMGLLIFWLVTRYMMTDKSYVITPFFRKKTSHFLITIAESYVCLKLTCCYVLNQGCLLPRR